MRQNSFRIIAGQWRGRRLPFPDNTSVRPTGDRVRETLFNWLQPYVAGAKVLDLYAGSGALGLEALSRGAEQACFVEQDKRLAKAIGEHIALLGASANVSLMAVGDWFVQRHAPVDLVFLDPPYPLKSWSADLQRLASGCLKAGALVYTEQPSQTAPFELPAGFSVLKERTAGHVRFMLLQYQLNATEEERA